MDLLIWSMLGIFGGAMAHLLLPGPRHGGWLASIVVGGFLGLVGGMMMMLTGFK